MKGSKTASKLLIASSLTLISQTAFCDQFTAQVNGFTHQSGKAVFVLYDSKKGFASDLETAVATQTKPIDSSTVSATFEQLESGDYALFVFHDEDGNGEFKTNWVGFPKEGAGNSNNHQGIPSFKKSSFNPAQVDELVIDMWYP